MLTLMAKTVNGLKTKLERERAQKMGLFSDWRLLDLGAVTGFRSGHPASILQVFRYWLRLCHFVDSTELFTALSSDFAVCLPTDCRLHVVEELIQRCQRYTTATDCFCTLCNYWVHINFTQNKRCLHKTQLSLHLPCSCSKTHTVSSNRESKLHVKYSLIFSGPT